MASVDILNPVGSFPVISPSQIPPPLRSYEGGYIAKVGLLRETNLDASLEEMRHRFDEEGYIFVKGLIPREDVLAMREHYFEHMRSTGILKSGTTAREGIFNDSRNPEDYEGIGGRLAADEKQRELLMTAHQTPEYLAFVHHPALRAFVRKFMGWAEDVEAKRTLLRHNVPHSMSTAIHYDKVFLRAGDAYPLTAWVPIGDCAANGGGLIYLENSSQLGETMEEGFTERAQVLPPDERISAYNVNMDSNGCFGNNADDFGKSQGGGRRWLTADYEAGDVVFHNPYLLHASGRNEDLLGRIRLSTDLRFYEKGAPGIDERWMKNFWFLGDGL